MNAWREEGARHAWSDDEEETYYDAGRWMCPVERCGARFREAYEARRHIHMSHSRHDLQLYSHMHKRRSIPEIECQTCRLKFETTPAFRSHIWNNAHFVLLWVRDVPRMSVGQEDDRSE